MAIICASCARYAYAFEVKRQSGIQQFAFSGGEDPHPSDKKSGKKKKRETPLLQVLKELNRKRGVYFLYTDKAIGELPVADIAHPKADLEEILRQLLSGTGLRYTKINDKTFVILKLSSGISPGAMTDTASSVEDDKANRIYSDSVYHVVVSDVEKGFVTDATGNPLNGVSVTVKGSGRGTMTDDKGSFVIEANRENTLIFSSIGYRDKEYPVKEENEVIKVALQVSEKEMTEVVMTALGIQKKVRSLGYATTNVAGASFTADREMNFGNALTAKIAGVTVSGDATGPYGSSRVVIRGNSSLNGNNQPLYVVDGVPYDNTNQGGSAGQYGGQDFGDGLSNINPDNIESIQVLKGVAASSLYGYRGGNGAILITTKSGVGTKGFAVELNDNVTINALIDETHDQYTYGQGLDGIKPTTQTAAFAAPYYSWGAKMDGSAAVNFVGNTYAYLPQKDHFSSFYKKGVTNQSLLALEGANDKGHFRLGLTDVYLTPVIPQSNMMQVGVNLNSSYMVLNRLQLTLTGNYVSEDVTNRASFSDNPGNAIASTLYLANSFDMNWLKPQTNASGMELLPGADTYFDNPYFVAHKFQNHTSRDRLTGGVTLKYNLLDWLYLQGQGTRDGYIFDVTNTTPTGTGYSPGGNFTQYELTFRETNANFLVGMDKKWNRHFHISAELGSNSQDNVDEDYGIGAVPTLVQGIMPQRPVGPFIVPYVYNANNIAEIPYQRGYAHYRVNSVYANVDLSYKSLFYVTVTGRNDWYSTLNINSDSYFYPSFSGSFVFSDAWKLPSWITYGKIRASFAEASNGTAPYQNELTYGTQGYTTSNGQLIGYVSQTNIPNNNLKPINISESEFGVTMQFLHNRLSVDVAVYDKKTMDDILPVTISATSGYSGDNLNVGQIRNKGMEWLVSEAVIKSRHFSWNTSLNMSDNRSKVLYLGPGVNSVIINGALARWGSEVNISNVVGLPYGQIMGFAYKRDQKGDIVFGTNGEPEQTGVVPLGSGNYSVAGGWNNEFQWGHFALQFLLDYKFGAKIYSQTNLLLYYYGLQKNTLQGRMNGIIGKGVNDQGLPNTVAVPGQQYFQDISADGQDHIAEQFVYNAGFIKLRSFSLGFDLPTHWLGPNFIKAIRISMVGRNLLTLLKYTPNIDPESSVNATNGQGLELSGYPAIRSLGFDLNVKF